MPILTQGRVRPRPTGLLDNKGAFTKMNLFVLRTWLQAKFDKEQRGASLVEYVLLVALIALVVIAAVTILGNVINSRFSQAGSKLSG